ncbi:MbtH family NRPS accessory protein [Streptomyces caeni]|uniref:MbtH family NRPS accessory protein n=1 Tax=Streptomyces caeni TaxID=2307231 RepID=A0ABW4IVE3_9ACTN
MRTSPAVRSEESEYVVVINHERQYSIWPQTDHNPPAEWCTIGESRTRHESSRAPL